MDLNSIILETGIGLHGSIVTGLRPVYERLIGMELSETNTAKQTSWESVTTLSHIGKALRLRDALLAEEDLNILTEALETSRYLDSPYPYEDIGVFDCIATPPPEYVEGDRGDLGFDLDNCIRHLTSGCDRGNVKSVLNAFPGKWNERLLNEFRSGLRSLADKHVIPSKDSEGIGYALHVMEIGTHTMEYMLSIEEHVLAIQTQKRHFHRECDLESVEEKARNLVQGVVDILNDEEYRFLFMDICPDEVDWEPTPPPSFAIMAKNYTYFAGVREGCPTFPMWNALVEIANGPYKEINA